MFRFLKNMKNSDLKPIRDKDFKRKALKLLKKILKSIKLLGIYFSKIVASLNSRKGKSKDKLAEVQEDKFMSMCITLNTLLRSSFISYRYSTYLARVVLLEDKRRWIKSRNEAKRLTKEFEGLHYLNKFVNTEDARRLVRLNSFNKIRNSGLHFKSMRNVYKKRGSVKMFGLNVEEVIKASEAGKSVIKESHQESNSDSTGSEFSIDESRIENGRNFKVPKIKINSEINSNIELTPSSHRKVPSNQKNSKEFFSVKVNQSDSSSKDVIKKTPIIKNSKFFGLQKKTTLDERVNEKKKKKIEKKKSGLNKSKILIKAKTQTFDEPSTNLQKSKMEEEEEKYEKENVREIEQKKLTMEEFLAHLNLDLRTNLDHVFNSSLEEILKFFNLVENFMITILGGQELEVKIDLIKLIIRTTNAETFAEKIFMVSLMKLEFLQQWQTFDLFIQVLKFEMKLGIGF